MKIINRSLVLKLAFLHVLIIAVANYTVQVKSSIFGYNYTYAMFVFPIVILATDLTIRLSNQQNARYIVSIAYLPAILISVWVADWRIGVASGTAYLVGQLLDIFVFQRIRENTAAWWPAPLISTVAANILDTYTFFSVAFYNSADKFMRENWIEVATVDLCFKILVCILLFLPAYGLLLNFLQKHHKL